MKVGDKVVVKNFKLNDKFVCPEMGEYRGKLATIVDIYVDNQYFVYYLLDVDNQQFVWVKDMLEPAPESIKIDIPEGYIFDKVENNQIFAKREKKRLPKTWEECAISLDSTEFINDGSYINLYSGSTISERDKNIIPKGLGKPMLALMQLLTCREVYRQGWKPNWNNTDLKYSIVINGDKIEPDTCCKRRKILSFQSEEVRDEFLQNFRDLIEEAKELI